MTKKSSPLKSRSSKDVRRQPAAPERGSSLDAAFLRLRDLIITGQLAPGSWIVEEDLATRLGMSRTPTRGALHWLLREGYIIEQKRGSRTRMFIAPLTLDDARELYRLVGTLEGDAGRLLGSASQDVREKLADALERINDEIHNIAQAGRSNTRKIFDLDATFHRTMVEASAGPRLLNLYQGVKPQIERYWRPYASSILNDLHLSVAEHAEIITAIRKGQPRAIQKAIEANWTGGFQRVAELINLSGQLGAWLGNPQPVEEE
jgi:DNA-binding GntR family transcriptional regulator